MLAAACLSMLRRSRICGVMLRCAGGVKIMSSSSSSMIRSRSISGAAPWLILPAEEGLEGGKTVDRLYSLGEKKVLSLERSRGGGGGYEMVGSSHGWLALFNDIEEHLFLLNPLTGRSIDLPSVRTLHHQYTDVNGKVSCGPRRVNKVIITCDINEDEEEEECMAVMCYGQGDGLAFCFPARPKSRWIPFVAFPWMGHSRYGDFTYSTTRKVLTTIAEGCSGVTVEDWDLRGASPITRLSANCNSFHRPRFREEEDPHHGKAIGLSYVHHYVVVDDHDTQNQNRNENEDYFYVVRRYVMDRGFPDGSYILPITHGRYKGMQSVFPYRTIGFHVYKVDREGLTMNPMLSGFNGLAIFVGLNHTFALPAADHHLKPDSVYFSDSRHFDPVKKLGPTDYGFYPDYAKKNNYGGHDIGVFDAKTWSITPLYYPSDYKSIRRRICPAPMWFAPNHL